MRYDVDVDEAGLWDKEKVAPVELVNETRDYIIWSRITKTDAEMSSVK